MSKLYLDVVRMSIFFIAPTKYPALWFTPHYIPSSSRYPRKSIFWSYKLKWALSQPIPDRPPYSLVRFFSHKKERSRVISRGGYREHAAVVGRGTVHQFPAESCIGHGDLLKYAYTEKFRFMDKRLREISRFFVAPPRVFPLSVRARSRASTDLFIHKFLHLSI